MTDRICPVRKTLCFHCVAPCTAPEINPAAITLPSEEKPFIGVLKPFSDALKTVNVSTNFSDTVKVNFNINLNP